MLLRSLLVVCLVAASASCLVDVPLIDKRCGTGHPCLAGWLCVSGVCVDTGTLEACLVDGDCPSDERCTVGYCTPRDDGVDAGRRDDDAGVGDDDGGTGFDGGPGVDGGPGMDGGQEFDAGPLPVGEWWHPDWGFRIDVALNVGAVARFNQPVVLELDLVAYLTSAGINGAVDDTSVRVVEHDASGVVLRELPGHWISDAPGRGALAFTLPGVTGVDVTRRVGVYFDVGPAKGEPAYRRAQPVVFLGESGPALYGLSFDGSLRSPLAIADLRVDDETNRMRAMGVAVRANAGQFGSRLSGFVDLGATWAITQPPTQRLQHIGAHMVETVVEGGDLRVRELLFNTDRGQFLKYYRVENVGNGPATSVRMFQAMYAPMSATSGGVAQFSAADDTLMMANTSGGSDRHLGLRSRAASAAHSVGDPTTIFASVRDNALANNNNSNTPAGALAIDLPDVPAGGAVSAVFGLVYHASTTQMRDVLRALTTPLSITTGALVNRPTTTSDDAAVIRELSVTAEVERRQYVSVILTTRGLSTCSLTGPSGSQPIDPNGSALVLADRATNSAFSIDVECGSAASVLFGSASVFVDDDVRFHDGPDMLRLSGSPSVVGDVTVRYLDITDVSQLSGLTTVGGRMVVEGNLWLTSLAGLESLTTVGDDLELIRLPQLTSLSALASLATVADDLQVEECDQLSSLVGLSSLTDVNDVRLTSLNGLVSINGLQSASIAGRLEADNCPQLSSLAGISHLTSLPGGLILSNTGLAHLDDLGSMTALATLGIDESGLRLWGNPALQHVDGLASVTSFGDEVVIENNPALISLGGLIGLTSVTDDVYIKNNDALVDLTGLSNLSVVPDIFELSDSAQLQSVAQLTSLTTVGGALLIRNNPRLPQCEVSAVVTQVAPPPPSVDTSGNDPSTPCP